ncbi:hypothetical protein DM01DRAFT_1333885 [Hesseltinella vesiculosa]|uniref:Uncharacterized protein n=1 Tax=Hesseltinella vesiculosa TaxID=101127 RepID=A0A1X2GP14_9FUNG|nr:hypothetical protein DM01DRAFT_1333885 [Hesseltinella vesiculosa]
MITARCDPHIFPKERTPSPRLQPTRSLERRRLRKKAEADDIDRFIELAQAALDEAIKEEDAKGVIQELMERVIARTGAPVMAGVIAEQLRSQEVIEQLAEKSFDRQAHRKPCATKNPLTTHHHHLPKPSHPTPLPKKDEAVTRDQYTLPQPACRHELPDRRLLISEYLWRVFRLLLLASLVALMHHFVCTFPHVLLH